MKNLVILFVVFFSLFLTSCSDVTDSSMLTNPVMDKTNPQNTFHQYPYPYLFTFSKIDKVKFLTPENENFTQFYFSEGEPRYSQIYAVVKYKNDNYSKTYFINKIDLESFKIDGVRESDLAGISVYGLKFDVNGINYSSPFTNNSIVSEVEVSSWKITNNNIGVECAGIWPSSLKYLFAEITTQTGGYYVFLQKPSNTNFIIPGYGIYDVKGVKLFGNHAVTEAVD